MAECLALQSANWIPSRAWLDSAPGALFQALATHLSGMFKGPGGEEVAVDLGKAVSVFFYEKPFGLPQVLYAYKALMKEAKTQGKNAVIVIDECNTLSECGCQ